MQPASNKENAVAALRDGRRKTRQGMRVQTEQLSCEAGCPSKLPISAQLSAPATEMARACRVQTCYVAAAQTLHQAYEAQLTVVAESSRS